MTAVSEQPARGDDLVVNHAVVTSTSARRRITVGSAWLVLGVLTILGLGLGANSGDASFGLSQFAEKVHIPTLRFPGGGAAIVCGALICGLGLWHAARGVPARLMRWVSALVALLFFIAFLSWAATGNSSNPIDIVGLLQQSIFLAVPIILGSMAGVMCERTGVINIAIEGQMLVGAFAGALVASVADNLGAGIVAALLAGGLFGALLAVFAISFYVNQVVLGVVLNLLALGLTGYLYDALMQNDSQTYNTGVGLAQHKIPLLGDIPILGTALFNANWIVYAMYVLLIVINVALFRTRWGLRTRAVGEHPRAAATVGIKVRWTRYRNVILGGMIAGLGGAFLTIGTSTAFQKNPVGMTSGKGYIALAALIFGRWSPMGALGAALLFGLASELQPLLSGSTPLNIPSDFWLALPYLATLLAVAGIVGRVVAPAADGEPYAG
jgi:general nucleoside transport system permease protein